jgi:hypothetical protein
MNTFIVSFKKSTGHLQFVGRYGPSSTLMFYTWWTTNELKFYFILFYSIRENSIFWKAYIVGSGEQVKLWLFQAFIKDARSDSNSRSAVQISSPLLSR